MKILTDLDAAHPALRQLVAHGPPGEPAVGAFLDRHDFPLTSGRACTFVFRGPAKRVALRHWVEALPSLPPFRRIPDTDLWFLVLELPAGSRVEYKLEVARDGTTHLAEDPLNPRRARDPFGANSICRAEGYRRPDWSRPDPEVPGGTLQERLVRSRALGDRRCVTLYQPVGFPDGGPYPLLVVHDGTDHLRYAALGTVLDNLIHRGDVAPLVAALVDPGERHDEYVGSDAHARYLLEELVPGLEARLPLVGAPEGRVLMGASLGAVASLHAAAREPGFAGGLLLQSGSFVRSDRAPGDEGEVSRRVAGFVDAFFQDPVRVSERVFLSCGAYEPLVRENRALAPVLRNVGMELRYVEARDGHNWANWRDRLREGLSWLIPSRPVSRPD